MLLKTSPLKDTDSATCIYKHLKILKFNKHHTTKLSFSVFTQAKPSNIFFLWNFSLWTHPQLLKRSTRKIILEKPYSQTFTYGTIAVMNNFIKDWKKFKKSFPKLFKGQLTYPRIKSILKAWCALGYQPPSKTPPLLFCQAPPLFDLELLKPPFF